MIKKVIPFFILLFILKLPQSCFSSQALYSDFNILKIGINSVLTLIIQNKGENIKEFEVDLNFFILKLISIYISANENLKKEIDDFMQETEDSYANQLSKEFGSEIITKIFEQENKKNSKVDFIELLDDKKLLNKFDKDEIQKLNNFKEILKANL